jgi:hypothetical protein
MGTMRSMEMGMGLGRGRSFFFFTGRETTRCHLHT